jgi:DNA-binding transcriptional regulator YhcF (GntR family)
MEQKTASISELARIFNLDRATVSKRLKDIEPASQVGYKGAKEYTISEVTHLLQSSAQSSYGEEQAKVRRAMADAEKAEINVAKLRGELVSVSEMKDAVHTLVKSLFQRCVVVSPRALARKIIGKSDPGEVEIILRAHYSEIFEELRALPTNFLNNTEETDEENV